MNILFSAFFMLCFANDAEQSASTADSVVESFIDFVTQRDEGDGDD